MARALFLSHGSPMMVLEETPARRFLRSLAAELGRPRAVLAVSAHWETAHPALGAAAAPATVHDFHGFPAELYRQRYPAPGAPDLARRLAPLLGAEVSEGQGLDHGIWSVMSQIWPGAELPVVPLSVQPRLDPRHHYDLGLRLKEAAEAEGLLVLATGAATHNLAAYMGRRVEDPTDARVTAFTHWLAEKVEEGDAEALLDYRGRAPFAQFNHPSDEHLLPLFTALGAAGGAAGRRLHHSVEYGVIAMDAYCWD